MYIIYYTSLNSKVYRRCLTMASVKLENIFLLSERWNENRRFIEQSWINPAKYSLYFLGNVPQDSFLFLTHPFFDSFTFKRFLLFGWMAVYWKFRIWVSGMIKTSSTDKKFGVLPFFIFLRLYNTFYYTISHGMYWY